MIYGYHLTICLGLVLIQTILPVGDGPAAPYDLFTPFVIYLGVYRPLREAIPALVLAGLAMDSLSGGVFGVHLTVYWWMYAGVRWAVQFLHVGNVILLPMLVTVGVAFESLVAAFSAVVLASAAWPAESILPVFFLQVLWGAVTGPFLVLIFIRGHKWVDRFRKSLLTQSAP